MKMNSTVRCCGIKESDVTIEGKSFSSTKFHLIVDIADNTAGESCGFETRPFAFGDASEFKKWKHLKAGWPEVGIMVDCVFDVVAASDNKTKLTLLDIHPSKTAAPGAKV